MRNRKDYKYKPGVKPKSFASALNIKAREFKPILGGDYSLTVRFESVPNEKIYRMGQYQQPYLNLKACEWSWLTATRRLAFRSWCPA